MRDWEPGLRNWLLDLIPGDSEKRKEAEIENTCKEDLIYRAPTASPDGRVAVMKSPKAGLKRENVLQRVEWWTAVLQAWTAGYISTIISSTKNIDPLVKFLARESVLEGKLIEEGAKAASRYSEHGQLLAEMREAAAQHRKRAEEDEVGSNYSSVKAHNQDEEDESDSEKEEPYENATGSDEGLLTLPPAICPEATPGVRKMVKQLEEGVAKKEESPETRISTLNKLKQEYTYMLI